MSTNNKVVLATMDEIARKRGCSEATETIAKRKRGSSDATGTITSSITAEDNTRTRTPPAALEVPSQDITIIAPPQIQPTSDITEHQRKLSDGLAREFREELGSLQMRLIRLESGQTEIPPEADFASVPSKPDKQWLENEPIKGSFSSIELTTKKMLELPNCWRSVQELDKVDLYNLCKLYKVKPDDVPLQAIINETITSFLKRTIFETEFPHLDEECSALLTSYRNIVKDRDGPDALDKLDLAAYGDMINSISFRKEHVPKKSKTLAADLRMRLVSFTNVGSNFKAMFLHLKTISETALLAKADSVLNPCGYSITVYPPGTKFDETTMRLRTLHGVLSPEEISSNRVIQVCTGAAVHTFAKVTDATNRTNNFCSRVGQKDIRLVIPAIVILREE
ncbi:hypothetical protein V502_00099 [Pseudogymnoascus sp. VKM F-4520 (FW-2644)]|nr:hypothetical protein V502_00099 [Pseudogymnoascus sp. VKM F-4520 (FW-2644)]